MIRIYVATQRPLCSTIENYVPLMVGRSDVEPNDATGDSISARNKFYCELTGQYWIWKNDRQSEIVGLCQYRRLLWIARPPLTLCSRNFNSIEDCREHLDTRRLGSLLDGCDIILPRRYAFSCDNIETQFVRAHRRENFELMIRALGRTHAEYLPTAREVFARRTEHLANLLIARKELFDEYSHWLFDVLFEVERSIELNDANARMLGYMGERLLNVYVEHNRLRVKEVPLIFIDERQDSARIDWRYVKRRYLPTLLTVEEKIRRGLKMR